MTSLYGIVASCCHNARITYKANRHNRHNSRETSQEKIEKKKKNN